MCRAPGNSNRSPSQQAASRGCACKAVAASFTTMSVYDGTAAPPPIDLNCVRRFTRLVASARAADCGPIDAQLRRDATRPRAGEGGDGGCYDRGPAGRLPPGSVVAARADIVERDSPGGACPRDGGELDPQLARQSPHGGR